MIKVLILLGVAAAIWIWWRRWTRRGPVMNASEARALLGIGESATLKEVREAHRRLIAKVHPDAGGSAELATRVNAARDVLVAAAKRSPARRG